MRLLRAVPIGDRPSTGTAKYHHIRPHPARTGKGSGEILSLLRLIRRGTDKRDASIQWKKKIKYFDFDRGCIDPSGKAFKVLIWQLHQTAEIHFDEIQLMLNDHLSLSGIPYITADSHDLSSFFLHHSI